MHQFESADPVTDMTKTGGGSCPPAPSVFTALHSHRVRSAFSAKGQLISERNFGVFKSPKK
jgi:hypothetical protein